ncbi:CopG family transcriptional regulator [Sinorhizobium meliloti]|uniref:CopG family transcriptional regulator n=1 Tax=Rhizobium meliloti TaxID=382 RepID=UPI003A7F325A
MVSSIPVQHLSEWGVLERAGRNAVSLRRPRSSGERNGIPLLSPQPDAPPVTLEIVNALRDELP